MISRTTVSLIAIGMASFASAISMRLPDPVLPRIARDLGVGVERAAYISVVFTFAYAVAQPFLGPVADAVGKIRLIVVCVLLVGLSNLAAAFAPSFETLALARLVCGACAGGIIPVCMAAVGDLVAAEHRQVALARVMVATMMGQIAGSAIAGLLADPFGWRGVLAAGASVGLFAGIVVLLLRNVFGTPRASQPVSVAAALAGYRKVFANPRAVPLLGLVFAEGLIVYGLVPFIAAILEARTGLGPFHAGIVLSAFAVGGIVYGLAAGILVRLMSARMMMGLGGTIMMLALIVFAQNWPWWSAALAMLCHGCGFFLIHSFFQAQATELAPEARGAALAAFAFLLFLGFAGGPVIFDFLIRTLGTQTSIYIQSVGVLLLGLVAPRVLNLGGEMTRRG